MTMKTTTTPPKPGLSALRALGLCAAAGAILGPIVATFKYACYPPVAPAVGVALSNERLTDGRRRYPIPARCLSANSPDGEIAEEDRLPCKIEYFRAGCFYLTVERPAPSPYPVPRGPGSHFPEDFGCCLAPVLAQRLQEKGVTVAPPALPQGECRTMKLYPSPDAYEQAFRRAL